MALPSQTPGYRRRQRWEWIRGLLVLAALIAAFAVGAVLALKGGSVVWVGVTVMVLSVLIPVAVVAKAVAGLKKEAASRERGTVQLLTVASAHLEVLEHPDYWELTSEMQIRLDSGHTSRGSYYATIRTGACAGRGAHRTGNLSGRTRVN